MRPRMKQRIRHLAHMTRHAILIGGCGRSGTSVLSATLSCHPRIASVAGETYAFCKSGYSEAPDLKQAPEPDALYAALLKADLPEYVTAWCEKSPKNVRFIAPILSYLGEGARFINIIRDGRDVITSVRSAQPGRPWVGPKRWVNDVQAGLEYEGHPQVFTIRYEDLATDTVKTLKGICKFLSLPYNERFESFPDTARPVPYREYRSLKLRPIDSTSIGRWKQPEFTQRVEALLAYPGAKELLRHYQYL